MQTRLEGLMATDIETGPQPDKRQPSGTLFSGVRAAKTPVRVILHVDMDCFFASVATLGHPSFPGKPLCVAHSNSATVRLVLMMCLPETDHECEKAKLSVLCSVKCFANA